MDFKDYFKIYCIPSGAASYPGKGWPLSYVNYIQQISNAS